MRLRLMHLVRLNKLLACGLSILALAACSLPKSPPVAPTSWMILPERTGQAYQPRTDLWLKMGSVLIAPPFGGKSLVYRLGDDRYESDFYNVYAVLPNEIVGNASRKWLNNANIFAMTVGQSNSLFPYYTLQASVEEFYGDYRVRPEAVVSIQFFLTVTSPKKSNPIIGINNYSKRIALKDNTPQALVQGQQEALAQILTEYEQALYQYATKLPKPLGR
uniref:PqiC family protein n=1 Tax=Polynucleobacter sp. TaxID=2029855 RepID=UPI0040471496